VPTQRSLIVGEGKNDTITVAADQGKNRIDPTIRDYQITKGIRGIYALFKGRPQRKIYNVRYVGMSTTSVRGRLMRHREKKGPLWSHCSVFQVWENIRDEEIKELEGILRHIYHHDQVANQLNEMKSFEAFKRTQKIELSATRRST